MARIRFAYAGDREIAVEILDWLLSSGHVPQALLVASPDIATHAEALIDRCSTMAPGRIFVGQEFARPDALKTLAELKLDYIFGVHFPYVAASELLAIPRVGCLNLHPAYLPFNRGWHTASWAILDGTPAGATLHFMDDGIDSGDIILQKRIAVSPADTAHTLYRRLLRLETEVFKEAWPSLVDGTFKRVRQVGGGTFHRRRDLLREEVQKLDPARTRTTREFLTQLRALTTSVASEAAWFEHDGRRYRVRLELSEDQPHAKEPRRSPRNQ